MSEPTNTRTQLRQALGRAMRMPFYRRWTSLTPDVNTDAAKLLDTTLNQETGFWENQWVYVPTTTLGDIRQIVTFDRAASMVVPEYDFSRAITNTDLYEIQLTFNATEMHDAIDRARESAFPAFFDTVTDETMVVCEDTLEYSMSVLTQAPWVILKMWLENIDNGSTGTAAAGGATSITLASTFDCADMQTNPTRYRISIYDGVSKGDVRTPSAYNNTTKIATVSAWTATPTILSKYRVWDASSQTMDWRQIFAVKFDQKMWPSKFYLKSRYSAYNGARFRIQYAAIPASMSTESATTMVPSEYISEKAQAILYNMMANSNRFNRQRYTDLATQHDQKAEAYKQGHTWPLPDVALWQETDPYGDDSYGDDVTGNPLAWTGDY